MPMFQYKAVSQAGRMSEGKLDAPGRGEAIRLLASDGLRAIKIDEANAGASGQAANGESLFKFSFGERRISSSELERFTRQLSNLLTAGVPLSRALQILGRESSNSAASTQWRNVRNLVVDGASLADAMARYPETFPRVYVAMVRAGETGGFLDLVLNQVAEFQERDKELRSKITSALIYPAVLLVLAIGVLVFLLTFFIPRFQTIFQGFDAALPWLTRAIIAASEFLVSYGPFVAIGCVLIIYAVRNWLQSPTGRRQWQDFILRVPVVGPLSARFAMTRFSRMLGTLVRSGVELITALRVARESLGNQTLIDAIGNSIDRVHQGQALSVSLADCPQLFPGSVIEMVSVAEESGRLDEELVRIAETTEKELDGQLRAAVALTEPLMLFLIASFIGIIFIGMVIPIFTIQDYIK